MYPNAVVSPLWKNADYNFEIKVAKLVDYKVQFLFTEGLSNHTQRVKEGFEPFQHIELYFCLPDYWDLEKDIWPVDWLDRLATLPQKNNTWFGPGDTIPAGNPPQLLTDRFPANHFVLSEPILMAPLFEDERFKNIETAFLSIIPICQEELDYKLKNSATVLIRRIMNKGYSEKVDVFRTSVCRKRILGFL